ncbi:uncharacterized protein LOC122837430 [Gambusia affinis]|uniref:uncharacterized protein LOC122837430 n=1 Tax=Gambusia affinis TaxID=33528 RepID=UPI001CDC8797|nr:uncharacterized protein LOC122837430 [Gambusia affinis]
MEEEEIQEMRDLIAQLKADNERLRQEQSRSAPEVDASHGGLGAVLSQQQDGVVRPIAYASRGLRPTERNMDNYSSMKLEFLALKWAMTEKFREYLLGHKCLVFTDNNPLSYLSTAKLGATEHRWAAQLASFDFKIQYRSGRTNRNADALSRKHPSTGEQVGALLPGSSLPESLQLMMERQDAMLPLQSSLNAPQRISFLRQWDRLVEKDGVLHRKTFRPDGAEEMLQLLLPTALKEEVLTQAHQDHGHQGTEASVVAVVTPGGGNHGGRPGGVRRAVAGHLEAGPADVDSAKGGGDEESLVPPGGGDEESLVPPGGGDEESLVPPGGGDEESLVPPGGGDEGTREEHYEAGAQEEHKELESREEL